MVVEDGNGKIKDVSIKKACFCYNQVCIGDDNTKGCAICKVTIEEDTTVDLSTIIYKCQYQVLFLEEHRFATTCDTKKNKERETRDDAESAPSPPGTAVSLFYVHLGTFLDNAIALNLQKKDGRFYWQHIQDATPFEEIYH